MLASIYDKISNIGRLCGEIDLEETDIEITLEVSDEIFKLLELTGDHILLEQNESEISAEEKEKLAHRLNELSNILKFVNIDYDVKELFDAFCANCVEIFNIPALEEDIEIETEFGEELSFERVELELNSENEWANEMYSLLYKVAKLIQENMLIIATVSLDEDEEVQYSEIEISLEEFQKIRSVYYELFKTAFKRASGDYDIIYITEEQYLTMLELDSFVRAFAEAFNDLLNDETLLTIAETDVMYELIHTNFEIIE